MFVVVVRLSVHVHFNLGLSPRDTRVPRQCLPVCSISNCGRVGLTYEWMLDIMWCRAAVCTDVEAFILLDSALVVWAYICITAFTQVCRKRQLKGSLECKFMLIFCVEIVYTNLYNCIS